MIPLIYVLLVVENIGSFFYYFTKPIETTATLQETSLIMSLLYWGR